jgi:hypothetical protein
MPDLAEDGEPDHADDLENASIHDPPQQPQATTIALPRPDVNGARRPGPALARARDGAASAREPQPYPRHG